MLKEIQEELKSMASAAEVPKEAGQSLTSRAVPPAAKPAPIVGACGFLMFLCCSHVALCSRFRRCAVSSRAAAAQPPAGARPRTAGQPYPVISGGGFMGAGAM